jgi:hypothetical protein
MEQRLIDLPIEVLRCIIQHLLYNPGEPDRFRKYALLPFASTCRHLRDVSIEFLFWSVDLFEASFGLQHRVLKSNVALEHFHALIDYPVGYLRSGVRRFLVRDRDRTASMDLWRILEKLESLRSLHLDGSFGPETFPSAPQYIFERPENIRLYTTLVNLTFINCEASSPLFPFFLQSGVFVNLTRWDYEDKTVKGSPSPFAQLTSQTKPLFPYLKTVVVKNISNSQDQLCHLLHFMEIHSGSLQRLSVYMYFGAENRRYMGLGFDSWCNPEESIKQSTALLWKTVERLSNLRVLSVDFSCAMLGCAPESVIHLFQLEGLYVHANSSLIPLNWHYGKKIHPVHPV